MRGEGVEARPSLPSSRLRTCWGTVCSHAVRSVVTRTGRVRTTRRLSGHYNTIIFRKCRWKNARDNTRGRPRCEWPTVNLSHARARELGIYAFRSAAVLLRYNIAYITPGRRVRRSAAFSPTGRSARHKWSLRRQYPAGPAADAYAYATINYNFPLCFFLA